MCVVRFKMVFLNKLLAITLLAGEGMVDCLGDALLTEEVGSETPEIPLT